MNNISEEKKAEAPGQNKEYKIYVNTRERLYTGRDISFEEVVKLAFNEISNDPNTVYTVTYERGQGNKPEGTMIKGQSVHVKEEMIFYVTATNRS